MASSSGSLLQIAFAAGMAGGGLLFKVLKNHKRIRKVADTPRSKVASAPQGLVELEGFAWPQGETVRTLDNEEAIYYVIELQEERESGSGKNRRRSWVTVFNYEHVQPFYLLDPTGIAHVLPHNSEVAVTNATTRGFSGLSPEAQARVSELVNGTVLGFPPSTGLLGKLVSTKYRVVERKLVVGSPFYAVGDFKTHSFNQITIDDSLATFANKVINFDSRSLKNVSRLLDRDGDGRVSHAEALLGYTTAAKLSRLNPLAASAPLEVFGVLDSSENHKLFFADSHEGHLLESLSRWQNLKLVGGAGLVTTAICLCLLEFGLVVNPFEAARSAERARVARELASQAELRKEVKTWKEACDGGQKGFCRHPSSDRK